MASTPDPFGEHPCTRWSADVRYSGVVAHRDDVVEVRHRIDHDPRQQLLTHAPLAPSAVCAAPLRREHRHHPYEHHHRHELDERLGHHRQRRDRERGRQRQGQRQHHQ